MNPSQALTPEELEAELAGGRVRPAYLLAGVEPLLREDALAALRDAVLAGAPRDWNHDRLDGAATAPGDLLDAVRALPVLAPRRLVELREPEARGAAAAPLLEALCDAVEELREAGGTVLAVVCARADRRTRWVKAFAEPAVRVDCEPPRRPRELHAFVRREARRTGVRLEAGVAEALAEAVGPQLLLLRRELEKAALHAGSDRPVRRADVEATASLLAEEPVWELTDAIGEGRTADALGVLARLLDAGAPPPVLLAALAGHQRKLVRARAGRPAAGHPFAVRKLEGQARRQAPARLLAGLRALHDADEALKGQGGLAPRLVLERLVLGLAR